jgi:serine protease Do
MASFDFPEQFDPNGPPPRVTTPPVRRGFLMVLAFLSLAAALVYGVPYAAEQTGYAWETGRARAASQALEKLSKKGIVSESSALFRMATTAVAPAVVNVGTRHAVVGRMGGRDQWDLGSGVVIDKDKGFIVTNHHVVKEADDIFVKIGQGAEMPAQIVGTDPQTDLAVIQVQGPLRYAAEWGDSNKLEVGDWVLAIGSPFALDRTVTAGIVSATGRRNLRISSDGSYEEFIQTDAAINPGNSGGPLVDLSGKVVGINTAIISDSGRYEGIGLAIASDMARKVVNQLIHSGHAVRGYIGVLMAPLDAARARKLGLADSQGILIDNLDLEGPAAKAGLKPGDVLVQLENTAIEDMEGFRNRVASLPVGTSVPITYVRDGERATVAVTIAEKRDQSGVGLRPKQGRLGGPQRLP